MPDIQNCGDRDFSVYDSMSDEELEKLLRDDFSKQEGEGSDIDMLLSITEVLADRRKEKNGWKSPAEAWESFEQNYYTEDDYFDISETVPAKKKRTGRGHWRWGLIGAAAMLAIVIGTSATARALKFDLWGVFVKWTQETFQFSSADQPTVSAEPNASDTQEYAGLQEVLTEYNVSVALVPTWFPEGYEEVDIKISENSRRRTFIGEYKRNEETIVIRIADYLNSDPSYFEQSDAAAEIYTANGVDYYIFRNNARLQAAWINEGYECSITGRVSVSEMKEMIDSIGKG